MSWQTGYSWGRWSCKTCEWHLLRKSRIGWVCVLAVFFIPKGENGSQSGIEEQINSRPVQEQAIPSFPAQGGNNTEKAATTAE